MRTSDVKVNMQYLYKGEIRRVTKRIRTKVKIGQNRTSFLLDNGSRVSANELEEIN